MSTIYAWFLPTARAGDGHTINTEVPERLPTVEYLSKIAQAAEEAGFINLLVPTGTHCLDPWTMAGAVSQHTKKIKFCVAFRPGIISPVLAAQVANTVDQISGGRLTVNVVTGSGPTDQMRYGDHLVDHDERYARTDEFMDIVKMIWSSDSPINFKGNFYDIRETSFFPKQISAPRPAIYMGGSSDVGRRVGAKHSDVHMMYAVEVETIAEDVLDMRKRAEEFNRQDEIKFGIRIHIVCRETKKEAHDAANKIIEGSSIANTSVWNDMKTLTQGVGQQRINERGSRESLWLTDTLWMGVNKVRGGAGASLVGTPEMIAAALKEYVDVGVECFILSGWPHVEEAEIFGKEIMPLLKSTEPVAL